MTKSPAPPHSIYEELLPRELSKADKRKASILSAAIEVYAHLGVEYVSNKDVARKAKTSAALVHYYFPEKYDLVLTSAQVVRRHFQQYVVEKIKGASDPAATLEAYVRASFAWAQEHQSHIQFWVFFMYLCHGHVQLRKEHLRMTEIGVNRIVDILVAGQNAKKWNTKLDNTFVAKCIQNQITGALFQIYTETGSKYSKKIEDATWQSCLSWLN